MPSPKSHEPRILITAGPTLEHLDPVRGILNRSSGKMGLALARACCERDLPVQVLLGPVESAVHDDFSKHAKVASYESSEDLQLLLSQFWPQHDLLFMAAAVSDLRPIETSQSKLPRSRMSIQLEPVPDLLAELANRWPFHGIRIGFALEHADQLLDRARGKLKSKKCHAIAANPLDTVGSEIVSGTWITPEGHVSLSERTKSEYASELLERSLQMWSDASG
ncbi:MAG: phosphopantothenoylcysteine decarboxylase [Planctomycetota bacterium]|nr:phosphopantothenoylcysteine decarboxylase [Planctomycetota bacterium]